ncbi:hypothetical protein [Brevundimonas sp.]|uniref:hypothetical protein n=1 Tax=Brevundimonas sp. TaxID=1871086 RepID=UPI0028985036|nr:hypothetical protein [Brevundimonas sp.]
MIRALSLAAALALLPVSAAVAQEDRTSAEAQLEAAAAAFESKMEEFGERAEAIQDDDALDDTVKGLRVAALWSEYQPHVTAFTNLATQQAGVIAQQALADIDVDAIVAETLAGVEPLVQGLATNGAWAQADPDQMVTYGLMADYAVGQSLEAIDEVNEALATPLAPPAPPAPPAEI